jgi:hypothetical protein
VATLRIELTRHGSWRLLNVSGRVDQETAAVFAEQLHDALITWSPIAVGLSDVELVDPIWLPVVAETHEYAVRIGRRFAVVAGADTAETLRILTQSASPPLPIVRRPEDLSALDLEPAEEGQPPAAAAAEATESL